MSRSGIAALCLASAVLASCSPSPPVPGAIAVPGPAESPPDGRALSGVSVPGVGGSFDSFLQVSGQPSVAVYDRFLAPGDDFSWIIDECQRRPVICMISWDLLATDRSAPGGTLASVARGDLDDYILHQAAHARDYGKTLLLRINYEMNAWWQRWGAFDQNGRPRPGNSPADYQRSWQRTRILFAGGSADQVSSHLQALGLPPLTGKHGVIPPRPTRPSCGPPTRGHRTPHPL